jgi:hypothetical protein
VPGDSLRAFLQGPHAATKADSLAVLHKGKAVVGNDKHPCVLNLKMRLVVAPVEGGHTAAEQPAAAAACPPVTGETSAHRREACGSLVVAAAGETTAAVAKRATPDSPAGKAGKELAAGTPAAEDAKAAAARQVKASYTSSLRPHTLVA